ncbi:MAG: asparagine synthetase B, partial [Bacteroidia bacterium]|nr:asparagine synthetase B [Bacteroidia bacterium]
KEVLYQYIPKEYFNRPKQGFAIPLNKWLKHELKSLINDYLNESKLSEHGLFNPNEIKKIIAEYEQGNDFLYNRIWQLLNFQIWYYTVYKTI